MAQPFPYKHGRIGDIPRDRTNAQESSHSPDRELQATLFASLQQPSAQRLLQQRTVQSEQKDQRDPENYDRSVCLFEPSADAKIHEVSRSDQNSPETAASTYAWSIFLTPATASHELSTSNLDFLYGTQPESSFTTRHEFDDKFGGFRIVVAQAIEQGAGVLENVDVGVFRAGFCCEWEDYVDYGGAVILQFKSHPYIAQSTGNPNNLWYGMLLAMIDSRLSFSDDIVALVLRIGQEANPVVTIEVWLETQTLKGDAESTKAEIKSLVQRYETQIRCSCIKYEPFSIRLKKKNMALLKVREHENNQHHSEKEALRSVLAHNFLQLALDNAQNSMNLQSEMDTLRSERDSLQAAKFMNDKLSTSREAKINELEKEIQGLRVKLEKASRDVAWYKAYAARYKTEHKCLMRVNDENVQQHKKNVQQVMDFSWGRFHLLKAKYQELQAHLHAQKRYHDGEIQRINVQLDRAQKGCELYMNENRELRRANAELKKKLNRQ